MGRFNSFPLSSFHLSTFFIVLLIWINHHSTSATKADFQHGPSIYDDLPYDDINDNDSVFVIKLNELPTRNPWPNLFHNAHERTKFSSLATKGGAPFVLQAKRSIPIELQKALFAHGIVGRRR